MDREMRQYQQNILGEFAHIGEATEEELREQREYDQQQLEEQAAEAIADLAEEAEELEAPEEGRVMHTQRDEWDGFAQEEGVRAFEEAHEQVDPAHEGRLREEEAERRLREAEEEFARAVNQQEQEVDAATTERLNELTMQLREQIAHTPQLTNEARPEAVAIEPIQFTAGHVHNPERVATDTQIGDGRITTGAITAQQVATWGNITVDNRTFGNPRRYRFDFTKVNSMQDIIKVLEVMQIEMHLSLRESKVEELGLKHLVDRIDDREDRIYGW